jgi:hypothetical protein
VSGTIALSADYSQDELDAVADAFGVRWLGSARLLSPSHDRAVLEASLATALRGLVARRALVLEGTSTSPRIRLLEPHATLLETFVHPQRIVRVDVRAAKRFERRVAFVRGEVAVAQERAASPGIVRMTAHPALALERVLIGPLELVDAGARADRRPFELPLRALDAEPGDPALQGAAVELRHARRRRIDFIDTTVDGHRVTTTHTSWIDGGRLGWWRVDPEGDPAVLARLVPVGMDAVRDALDPRSPAHA